jgi:hypothetical protein
MTDDCQKQAPSPQGVGSCTVGATISSTTYYVRGPDGCAVQITRKLAYGPTCEVVITYTDKTGAAWTGSTDKIEVQEIVGCVTIPPPPVTKSYDREKQLLCAPDGTKVWAVSVWDTTAAPTTPPIMELYNALTGAVYTGASAALTSCPNEKIDLADGEDYCAAGVNYTRVDAFDVNTLLPVASIWLNDAGLPVVAPTAPTKGACRPSVYVDRPICGNTNAGEIWNFVERTFTDSANVVTVKYLDPDTSPMADVTSLFNSMRHGGASS